MVCSLDKVERIVIGTMLNDFGEDCFFSSCSMSLRKELFSDRRNAFIFDVISRMNAQGLRSTTPYDVLSYVQTNKIRCGNVQNFVSYMTELACESYSFSSFRDHVRTLVRFYSSRRRMNGAG